MGVSGTGKSSVAAEVAQALGVEFVEGDDLHPQANREKMAAGTPLTDQDRWPWLEQIRDWMQQRTAAGVGSVVTCSALRRIYRDLLRGAGGRVVFVHLHGERALLEQRLGARAGHFFPPALLGSQLETLEPLGADEDGFLVDVSLPLEAETQEVLERLEALRH